MRNNRGDIFTTYGVVDPRSSVFVYIGQTSNFEFRKAKHMDALNRPRPRIESTNIRTWMHDTLAAGIVPLFIVLETVDTQEKSLQSEAEWVARLAAENHPLINKWGTHKELIRDASDMNQQGYTTLDSCRQVATRGRKGSEKVGNHGKVWFPQDDRILKEMFRQGCGGTEIAKALARTLTAVRARLVRLGEVPDRASVRA